MRLACCAVAAAALAAGCAAPAQPKATWKWELAPETAAAGPDRTALVTPTAAPQVASPADHDDDDAPAGSVPADPPAAPPAAAAGGGSHGGGSHDDDDEPPLVSYTGTVTAASSGAPLAGATVAALGAYGAVTTTSGADGTFTISGPALRPFVAARLAGRRATGVGFDPAGPATIALPLLPETGMFTRDPDMLPVSGTVVDGTGAPVANVLVVGADDQGDALGPLYTDAAGRYSGYAEVKGDMPASGIGLLAWDGAGRRLAAGRGIPDADGDLGPLALLTDAGQVQLRPDVPGPTGLATTIKVQLADGPSLVLGAWDAAWDPGPAGQLDVPFYALSGLTTWAEVRVTGVDGTSQWRAPVAAAGPLAPKPLPLPGPIAGGTADTLLTWEPVPDAEGYTVALRSRPEGTLLWEARTTAPEVPLVGWPAFDAAELEVTATRGTTHWTRRLVAAQ